MSARSVAFALGLACVMSAVPVGAFTRTGGVWRTLPVNWYWNPSTVPPSLGGADFGRMALEAGFATWASAPCTVFTARNAGMTTVVRGNARDRTNTLAWISGSWPAELGAVNTVIGVTLPVSSGGANIDADIMFNNVGFTWSLDGRRGTVDTQSIAVHEEGHFLGLGHSTVPSSSIMYPSYPGRPSRVMSSDDTNGVCTLYPRTGGTTPDAGAAPDASTPADPCNAITSCGECTPQATCGWCGALNRCMTGNATSATVGTCPGGWAPYPMNCTATSDAGAGSSPFGGACRVGSDCASGGPCVSISMGTPFCSQRCIDDCTCPRGYRCVMASATLSLCIPGTNTCGPDASVPPSDASTPPPPSDASTPPPPDASDPMDASEAPPDAPAPIDDASTDVASTDDAGSGSVAVSDSSGGCGCHTPARSSRVSLFALALVAAALRRRRR